MPAHSLLLAQSLESAHWPVQQQPALSTVPEVFPRPLTLPDSLIAWLKLEEYAISHTLGYTELYFIFP